MKTTKKTFFTSLCCLLLCLMMVFESASISNAASTDFGTSDNYYSEVNSTQIHTINASVDASAGASNHNPKGYLDSIDLNSNCTKATFRGWAYDPDYTNQATEVHIYFDNSVFCGVLTANKSRPDVHKAFGCGSYHGYNGTVSLPTILTGRHSLYIYAINKGTGNNICIGCKTYDFTTYKKYTGVSYTDKGLSTARVKAIDKAVKLATIYWYNPVTFPTWKSSKGVYNIVTATDGTSAKVFLEGKCYLGIPYSMADHSYTDTKWAALVCNGFSSAFMTGGYDGRTGTTAHGIDCSYLIYLCMKAAGTNTNVEYLNTSAMLNSSLYIKKSGLSVIKGGDILLKNGHTMLFVGKVGSQYAVIEASAEGSRVQYNTYSSSELSSYSVYKFKGFVD